MALQTHWSCHIHVLNVLTTWQAPVIIAWLLQWQIHTAVEAAGPLANPKEDPMATVAAVAAVAGDAQAPG